MFHSRKLNILFQIVFCQRVMKQLEKNARTGTLLVTKFLKLTETF